MHRTWISPASALSVISGRSTSGPRPRDDGASGRAAGRRRSCRPRPSLAARVDQGKNHVVIDGGLAGRDEHAVLFDQLRRPAGGKDLRAGAVGGDVGFRARKQSQCVADGQAAKAQNACYRIWRRSRTLRLNPRRSSRAVRSAPARPLLPGRGMPPRGPLIVP